MKEQLHEWARWVGDKLIENWRVIAALLVGASLGAVATPCPEPAVDDRARCIVTVGRCLEWMEDTP